MQLEKINELIPFDLFKKVHILKCTKACAQRIYNKDFTQQNLFKTEKKFEVFKTKFYENCKKLDYEIFVGIEKMKKVFCKYETTPIKDYIYYEGLKIHQLFNKKLDDKTEKFLKRILKKYSISYAYIFTENQIIMDDSTFVGIQNLRDDSVFNKYYRNSYFRHLGWHLDNIINKVRTPICY